MADDPYLRTSARSGLVVQVWETVNVEELTGHGSDDVRVERDRPIAGQRPTEDLYAGRHRDGRQSEDVPDERRVRAQSRGTAHLPEHIGSLSAIDQSHHTARRGGE